MLKREISPDDYEKYYADELPQHKVCVDEFWMGIHEVTQSEWQKVMGFNPAVFQDSPDYPVDMVSWDDAQLFVDKLNELNNTSQFRLPTEAEWEYAARAGTTTLYHTGETITGSQANFNGTFPFAMNLRDEYRKSPTAVVTFPANAFGLHDMHGNVWEWCSDWYQSDYYTQAQNKIRRGRNRTDESFAGRILVSLYRPHPGRHPLQEQGERAVCRYRFPPGQVTKENQLRRRQSRSSSTRISEKHAHRPWRLTVGPTPIITADEQPMHPS